MKIGDRPFYKIFLVLMIIMPLTLFAGHWIKVHENDTYLPMNDAVSMTWDLSNVYAVADNGMLYVTYNYGYGWYEYKIDTTRNLRSLAGQIYSADYYYEKPNKGAQIMQTGPEFILCGDNGALFRYEIFSDIATPIDTLTKVNLNKVRYDFSHARYWLVGDSGFVAYSVDNGFSWERWYMMGRPFQVKDVYFDYNYVLFMGNDSVNVYINKVETPYQSPYTDVGTDTLYNEELIAAVRGNRLTRDYIYFITRSRITGEYSLWRFLTYTFPTYKYEKLDVLPFSNVSSINLYGNYLNYLSHIWVTTTTGEIWQATNEVIVVTDQGLNWKVVFKDELQRGLGPIITSTVDDVHGMALGDKGVVVLKGFKLLEVKPRPNHLVNNVGNFFYATFMTPPDISSLDSSVFLRTNYSGYIPLRASYETLDSTTVTLVSTRFIPQYGVPGEEWEITFTREVHAYGDTNNSFAFQPMDYRFRFYPPWSTNFNFSPGAKKLDVQRTTTNWAIGFFNPDDDRLDFVTYTRDSLICIFERPVTADSMEWVVQKVAAPSINYGGQIKRQLKVVDFNHDILPDLMLFDNTQIYFLINTSTTNQMSFTIAQTYISLNNIKDVIPVNDLSDLDLDLVVLSDNILLFQNVNPSITNPNYVTIRYNALNTEKIAVADINGDYAEDVVEINNGNILVGWGDVKYGLQYLGGPDTLAFGSYRDIYIANVNNDDFPDILAISQNSVDVISQSITNSLGLPGVQQLFPINPNNSVLDIHAQDLGGWGYYTNPDYHASVLDIVLLTPDSLYVYENQTEGIGTFQFNPRPVYVLGDTSGYFLIETADWDRDLILDLALVNPLKGELNIFGRVGGGWNPQLRITDLRKDQVTLAWHPLPPDEGTVDYYRVYKSFSPDFNGFLEFYDVTDTIFVDHNVFPFADFWYKVEAFYNNSTSSVTSNLVNARIYHELSGDVFGVLADTTLPYWAKSTIVVPATEGVAFHNGVKVGFSPNAGLEVYGRFDARGNNDDQMVEFFPADSGFWNGITFYNASDTARFEWAVVAGSNNAISILGRQVEFRLGGVVQSFTGVLVNQNGVFRAENFVIDTVSIGVELYGPSEAYLKNVDILNAGMYSIRANEISKAFVKNAIVWFNNGPMLGVDSGLVFVDYSTVDSIGPRVKARNITKLPPLFDMNSDMGYKVLPLSPTIDAGDPLDDFSLEPQPNGGRINQGVFGNTQFATPSFQPRIRMALAKPLRTHANGVDSTLIFFNNFGAVELTVQSAKLKHGNAFQFKVSTPFTVAPDDTLGQVVYFKPTKRGVFTDSLIVVCNDPHLPQGEMQFALKGTAINSIPVLVNTPQPKAYVDTLYIFKPVFDDQDGDSVVVIPRQTPSWLTWTEGMRYEGTPSVNDTGRYILSFAYDDQHGGVDSAKFEITVYRFKQKPEVIFPIISVNPVGKLVSRQAAIKFLVQIKDSTTTQVKDATNSYLCQYVLTNKDGVILEKGLRKGLQRLEFYPLKDGIYTLKLRAFKETPFGELVSDSTQVEFKILASLFGVDRFRWHMMAVPRSQSVSWQQFKHPDSAAVLYRWNIEEKKYLPLNREEILPGQAFWIMPLKNLAFNVNPMPIVMADTVNDADYIDIEIPLEAGWNQVGVPAPFYKYWGNFYVRIQQTGQVLTLQQAASDSILIPAAFWFEQRVDFIGYHVQEMDSSAFAEPWKGYWIYAFKPCTLACPKLPDFPETTVLAKPVLREGEAIAYNFELSSGNLVDEYNVIGFSEATTSRLPEPPVFNEFSALAIDGKGGPLCKFMKPLPDDPDAVVSWELTVNTTRPGKEHILRWEQWNRNQDNMYAYLVDLVNEKVINLNEQNVYSFTPNKSEHRFKVYISGNDNFKPTIVPLQFKLSQNFPNPFNPSTTIKIGIPENGGQGRVVVRIFDVLGKEIKRLHNGPLTPGYHTFEWDGTNANGDRVSSGIYFYQLQAGKTSLMKKMVLLR